MSNSRNFRQFKREDNVRRLLTSLPLSTAATGTAIVALVLTCVATVLVLVVVYNDFLGGKRPALSLLDFAFALTPLLSGLVLLAISRALLRWSLQQQERAMLMRLLVRKLQSSDTNDRSLEWLAERMLGHPPGRLPKTAAKASTDLVQVQQDIAGSWALRHILMGNDIYAVPSNIELERIVEDYLEERGSKLQVLRAGGEAGEVA